MIEITWDSRKCAAPQDCRICLEACPQGVFRIMPKETRQPGRVTKDWEIGALFRSLCTLCGDCEQACPEKALAVATTS